MYGHAESVDALMEAGARADTLDGKLRTPLILAALNGETHACCALLAHGADLLGHSTGQSCVASSHNDPSGSGIPYPDTHARAAETAQCLTG